MRAITSPLLVGTSNPHKLQELRDAFAGSRIRLVSAVELGKTIPPVDEVGSTLEENARLKAATIARACQHWTLADDTGLEVDYLGGRPGVRTARYAGPGATLAQCRQKLLDQLAGVPDAERTGRFVCWLAIADPAGNIVATVSAECRGVILTSPQGAAGFGYDALFWMPGFNKTMAELDAIERCQATHRALAVGRLIEVLRELN